MNLRYVHNKYNQINLYLTDFPDFYEIILKDFPGFIEIIF